MAKTTSIRIDVADSQEVKARLRWASETIAALRRENEALRAALAGSATPTGGDDG